jgi:2,5-diketo-D-gluconate reductase A
MPSSRGSIQWPSSPGAQRARRRPARPGAPAWSDDPVNEVPALRLPDGRTIPQLGFGVFQIPPEETMAAVTTALEVGYRHIDGAQRYVNEREVGEAVRASGQDRSEVFLTSKLANANHLPDDARRSFDATLADLGTDHVDLFLIHWPTPTLYDGDFVTTWKVLEEFAADGRARSIGVSNFQTYHLERLMAECDVLPAVDQVEAHPYFANREVRDFCAEHGIVMEAWSPIAQGAVLADPVITRVAAEVGRTPAQVALRWHLQRGTVVFPKTSTPSRMRENLALFDFALDDTAMAALDGLDRGEEGRQGAHPDVFDYIPS